MQRFPFLPVTLALFLLSSGCEDGAPATGADVGDLAAELTSAPDGNDLSDGVDEVADEVEAAELDAADLLVPSDVEDLEAADALDPNRPLKDLEELREGTLRTALFTLVRDHVGLGYDLARDAMYALDTGIDVRDGFVECIYTGTLVLANGTHTPGGTFNTEHSWPQSVGASTEPARSDLHHLFPVLDSANVARSNNPYGETSCELDASCLWEMAGSALGPSVGSGLRVFEVRPVRRGDLARAQFYFSLRYQMQLDDEVEATLKAWNVEDPPDNRERVRNDRIEVLQRNRNPFIDRSDFVDLISDF